MRILVTGGAGFIGSHLIDRLMTNGHEVICLDNFYTGYKRNIVRWLGHPYFDLICHDITEPIHLEVDQIYHLACSASPMHHQYNPVKTIKTNLLGTLNMLELAKHSVARFLLASAAEVYGQSQIHPQREDDWGNVNPIGIRSCYDEGKRVAETLAFDYHRQYDIDICVARIFNTYGPRMLENDGRVVSNFIVQALRNEPLTVYGNGSQTRSFCYVADLVNGLLKLMNSSHTGPMNLGHSGECTILDVAKMVQRIANPSIRLVFNPRSQDDPECRRPDIARVGICLNWQPVVSLEEGLELTINNFRSRIGDCRLVRLAS